MLLLFFFWGPYFRRFYCVKNFDLFKIKIGKNQNFKDKVEGIFVYLAGRSVAQPQTTVEVPNNGLLCWFGDSN